MSSSQSHAAARRLPPRSYIVVILLGLLFAPRVSFADEEEGSSFWHALDRLSIDNPTDRFAIHSALGRRGDYLMIYGGIRARLSRRFNLVGSGAVTVLEDDEDPNYFGFHVSAQEDLIVRPNGRVYVLASYTVDTPSTTSSSPWHGQTVNEFGFGFGVSQGIGYFSWLRLFYEGTWNLTGKGTWRRPGPGGEVDEQTDDFTGYQFVFGGELLY
jgi:hypothetical protein